ncbi:hypothetical protein T492DRAFT_12721 [Pavlovales sp. CCMP2436]|nr:hypothetical protein T492DRAFT_12721 [Pavlovales sp. CCMP2436]
MCAQFARNAGLGRHAASVEANLNGNLLIIYPYQYMHVYIYVISEPHTGLVHISGSAWFNRWCSLTGVVDVIIIMISITVIMVTLTIRMPGTLLMRTALCSVCFHSRSAFGE